MKHLTTFLLLTSLVCSHPTTGQLKASVSLAAKHSDSLMHVSIQQKSADIYDSLVAIRRDFHRYPEVSGQEKRTSGKIAAYLSSLGLEVKQNIGGYGVVGTLKGAREGKKIAWRADIDAMPSTQPDVVDFESRNEGVRHICGHDVHTTVALGIANVMASQRENLEGTVYFVFQPSEENLKGAQAMSDDGLFEMIDPAEMYALHIVPFPAGTIATKSQEVFAAYKKLHLRLKKSKDSKALIAFSKQQINKLQNIEPESRFWNMINMGDPEIGIAGPSTVYKDYTIIKSSIKVQEDQDEISLVTYISTSDKEQQARVKPYLQKQFEDSEYAAALLQIEYLPVTPTVLNDEQLTTETMQKLTAIYGREQVIPLTGVVAEGRSDDFALFQEKVPGVYFFLGGSDYEKGVISEPHAPFFEVDERCIETGVALFSSMLAERLAGK